MYRAIICNFDLLLCGEITAKLQALSNTGDNNTMPEVRDR
jgi:hypothetical protein